MANILTNMKAASFRKIPISTKTTAASTNIMPAPFNNSAHLLLVVSFPLFRFLNKKDAARASFFSLFFC